MLLRASAPTLRSLSAVPVRNLFGDWPSASGRRTFHAAPTPLSSSPTKSLTVLGLESSADDSCCAIVNSNRQILANVVLKQHDINAKWGGIHPMMAQEAHERNVVSGLEVRERRPDDTASGDWDGP